MSKFTDEYPKYYDVDGSPVKVDYDAATNQPSAIHWDGSPRHSLVTQLDGNRISKETYDDAVETYRKYRVEKSITEKEFKQKISELFNTQFPDS